MSTAVEDIIEIQIAVIDLVLCAHLHTDQPIEGIPLAALISSLHQNGVSSL